MAIESLVKPSSSPLTPASDSVLSIPSVSRWLTTAVRLYLSPLAPSNIVVSWVPLLPNPASTFNTLDNSVFRVIMLTTPPMASAPYRLDFGPRIISIRWTVDKLIAARAAPPVVALPIRTPSIKKSV